MDPFGLCAQSDDPGIKARNLFRALYETIASGIAAAQVAVLFFESPDMVLSLPILAEAEGGATAAAEGAVDAESAVNTAGGTATQLEFNFANEFGQNSGLVIGRTADLSEPGALGPGEYKLGWFSVKGTSGMDAEWSINQIKLQKVMKLKLPIRDASPLEDTDGFYLNQERGLLQSAGWTYQGGYWVPPAP
jgi:hypothetical protein